MKHRITRQAQRYPIHLQLKELNGKPVTGTYLIDLSVQGARLESPCSLAPRSQVEFSFRLPDADAETRLAGVVLWTQPAEDKPGLYHLGVKFYSSFWFHDSQMMARTNNGAGAEEGARLVSFLGSKGGVGTTFLAANTAYLLARENQGRVLLVDLDFLYGQSIYFFSARPKSTIIDILEKFEHLDRTYLQGLLYHYNKNLSILPAPARLEEAEIVTPVMMNKLLNYLKNLNIFKWILLDCYHQVDEITLTTLESSDDIFLVTSPAVTALCNTRKQLELLSLLDMQKSRTSVILNSWRKCRNLSESEVVKFLGREVNYKIAFDPVQVERSIDEGHPLGKIAPKTAMSLGLEAVVSRLLGEDSSKTSDRWYWIKDLVKKALPIYYH